MNLKDLKIKKFLEFKEQNQPKAEALKDALASKHTHSEMQDWVKCLHCQNKYKEFMRLRQKMGLENAEEYLNWRKQFADPR